MDETLVVGRKVVMYNIYSPYSGTDIPIGTERFPVNNLKDAMEIVKQFGLDGIVDMNDTKPEPEPELSMYDKARNAVDNMRDISAYDARILTMVIKIAEEIELLELIKGIDE